MLKFSYTKQIDSFTSIANPNWGGCGMELSIDKARYRNLFQTYSWGQIVSKFEVLNSLPPQSLISNVNIVPFLGEKCVLVRLDNGKWEMPGGTLEPDEDYLTAIQRELLEEAGAKLVSSFAAFGAWKLISSAEKPYKPHLPHPISYRVVGYGDVELVSAPCIPEDGERVEAVEAMTLREAQHHFSRCGRADLAELYEIADVLRRHRVS
jgi:8-oxo-dGTP pyrophosphatase MutT (NUDIX family)